jgi:hypothetical protein
MNDLDVELMNDSEISQKIGEIVSGRRYRRRLRRALNNKLDSKNAKLLRVIGLKDALIKNALQEVY